MYFISKHNKKEGPYPLEDVLKMRLTDDVLIWKDGMTDWVPVSEIKELAPNVIKTPPPLPVEKQNIRAKELKDETQSKGLSIILNNAIIGLFLSLALAGIATIGGQSGGTDSMPVYLSKAERENSALLYWHFLPTCILISEIIMLCISLYKISQLTTKK